jgi:hypothetical protein
MYAHTFIKPNPAEGARVGSSLGALRCKVPAHSGQGHPCGSKTEKEALTDKHAKRGRGIGNDVRGIGRANKAKGRQKAKSYRGTEAGGNEYIDWPEGGGGRPPLLTY